jgi:hypothetical protein
MKKMIIIITLIFSFTSCSKFLSMASKPYLLDYAPPPGPVEFQAGYVDGCKTVVKENQGNIIAKLGNKSYFHPVMAQNSNLYRSTWQAAYTVCGLIIGYATRNSSSFWKPSFRIQAKATPFSYRQELIYKSPPGPRAFQDGWKDGCNTGKAMAGKSKHRMKYRFYKNASYIDGDAFDSKYDKGWNTALWYCQRHYDIMESSARRNLL